LYIKKIRTQNWRPLGIGGPKRPLSALSAKAGPAIDPRSAEELTPGELQDVDENMFNPTAGNRINLRERCNVDFNPRQQVVDFGAQAKSDYCRNRHAVDHDFQLHAPDRLEFVTLAHYVAYISNNKL
jgi:hypothetical protein